MSWPCEVGEVKMKIILEMRDMISYIIKRFETLLPPYLPTLLLLFTIEGYFTISRRDSEVSDSLPISLSLSDSLPISLSLSLPPPPLSLSLSCSCSCCRHVLVTALLQRHALLLYCGSLFRRCYDVSPAVAAEW